MAIRKQESFLKSKLMEAFQRRLPNYVALRHEDVRTSGIPDISLTGDTMTSWIEVKHATPSFEWRGIQHDTMMRLSVEGWALYVIYWEDKTGKKTLLVQPHDIQRPLETKFAVSGFDHNWVAGYFEAMHRS